MKIPKKIDDRRRSIRIAEELPFKIGHEGFEIEATSVNLSATGIMCQVNKDIPLMSQVQIALSLPIALSFSMKEKLVKAKGVVVRKEKHFSNNQFLIAIYFSDIKLKDQKVLDEFIEYRLKN